MPSIRPIQLPVGGILDLALQARTEGYRFIDRLLEEWDAQQNRFSSNGEVLLGAFVDGHLVAVGGLNQDPFANHPSIGRIRRVYVSASWRRRGIGESLVSALVDHARLAFDELRLRAENPDAARLYERLGFSIFADASATHRLLLNPRAPAAEVFPGPHAVRSNLR